MLAFVFKNFFYRLKFFYGQINFGNGAALFLRGRLFHNHLLKVAFFGSHSAKNVGGINAVAGSVRVRIRRCHACQKRRDARV